MGNQVTLVAKMASEISGDGPFIGIDRGALILAKANKQMLCAIGDFDSVNLVELEEIKVWAEDFVLLPREKDETDSESAIKYASDHNFSEIILKGASGGRADHFMANLLLVYYFMQANIIMEDLNSRIYRLNAGTHKIKKAAYKYLSLVAFERVKVSLAGVAYPLVDKTIELGDIFTISNEILEEYATITITDGALLIMECKD